jgi:predicted PurR-regulated permease PerM
MNSTLSGTRRASYALVLIGLAVIARFGLGHALIAGLFAFMMLDLAERALAEAGAAPAVARWCALGLFVVLGGLLAMIFFTYAKIVMARLPLLLDRLFPRLENLSGRLGIVLPVDNVPELRGLILETVKSNARSVTAASGLLTRGFFQIVVAVAAAVLGFLRLPAPESGPGGGLDEAVLRECSARLSLFAASFERVMGAQVVIAAINTGVTAVFLFVFGIPFRGLLVLTTFVCGMVPIVGNVLSNALIVAAALTQSDRLAATALVFLILVHKGEYFLNSRIIGARIAAPMWATLLGLLVGEALMGVTGVILAPTLIFYLREELRALPAR